jgi:alpha-ketoglutarate-dependent taurine dioxygenase
MDLKESLSQAGDLLATRGWAVVPSAGFSDGHTADPGAVRAIAQRFGVPSSRDGGIDIWPVRPVSRSATETFSRRAGTALLHTDAAYRPDPEPLFALFCVRPAADGGATRLLAATDALAGLDPRVARELRRPVWRWVPPAVFGGGPGEPRPVLSGGGARWRYDNLLASEPRMAVAAAFRDHIEAHRRVATLMLPADSVLICDNQRVLHGRTTFTDAARLLLRVRLVSG